MAAPTETSKPIPDSGAESPTTARPLEMDDDDVQETGIIGDDGNVTAPAAATATSTAPTTTGTKPLPASVEDEAVAPNKPPRPQTEAQKNELILKEAFPGVDAGVIRAVLSASAGKVEPAFNALLEMTDPDAVKNEPEETGPPPQPPRPTGQRAQMSQLEADELYARQLAEHYDNVGAYEARTSSRNPGGRPGPNPRGQQGFNDDEREHSFLDDDLPVIRDNLRKGFEETQKQVNGWITNIRKKIEENFDESEQGGPSGQGQQNPQQGQYARQGPGRRSGDYHRYDADPQVLSDDFAGMKFASDGTPVQQQTSGVYRPPPSSSSPAPGSGRRVGFRDETEEINMYDTSPRVPPKDTPPTSSAKTSKWQPLSSMDPNPIGDNDPFSLGDSEDEKETKEKPKDAKADDNERLKQAAAEAMADNLVDPKKKEEEEAATAAQKS